MVKVNRRTVVDLSNDPLDGYTLKDEKYFIHVLPVYAWDEISDCEKMVSTEREIYGPYDSLAEAQGDFDFLIREGQYKSDAIIIRKKGLYEYSKVVWLPMPLE